MKSFTKRKLRKALGISGIFLMFAGGCLILSDIPRLFGLKDLAAILAFGGVIGVSGASIFWILPFVFPEWYDIKPDDTTSELKGEA